MYGTYNFRTRIAQILLIFLCANGGNVEGRRNRGREYRISRSMEVQGGVSESGNLFAEDLYEALTKRGSAFEDRNLLMSPLSLDIGLAMLRSGANGVTKKEISRALRLNNDMTEEEVHGGYKQIIRTLKEESLQDEEDREAQIQLANKIFVGPVHPLKAPFLQTIRDTFGADAEQVNFGNMEAASNSINRWVREATRDRIKSIVSPSMLNNNTLMVLANAIHFKGYWKYPFDLGKTSKRRFTTVEGYDAQVEMMQFDNPRRLQYANIPKLGASVVALPYSTERYSFVIVLPDEGESLKDVEARIDDGTLADIPAKLSQATVDVRMPKQFMESDIDLIASKAVKTLGMTSMTTEFAEFGNISDEAGIHITNVLHKAFLEINEAGTEAAAASAIVAQARYIDTYDNVVKFVVNRPFLCYIYDAKTKTVLFIARKLM